MFRLHKHYSSLIAFILMVNLKAYQPLNPDDPNYFPPYECQNQPRLKGAATTVNIWPNGEVFYELASIYTAAHQAIILGAMKWIQDRTSFDGSSCISFKKRTTETNFIYVYSDNGCFSEVGMTGGKQYLSLMIGDQFLGTCLTTDTVAHEFIHALGFDHEQSRPDRDDYVEYLPDNLKYIFYSNNFAKMRNYRDLKTLYDVKSIMHYQSNAFAKAGTYTLLSRTAPRVILRNLLITDIDAYEIQLMYSCSTLSLNASINSITSTGSTEKVHFSSPILIYFLSVSFFNIFNS